jgi:hypothetical protein
MNYFPVNPETLKQLYENGHISSEALTAISPIQWLAANHPELLRDSQNAIAAIEALTPQQKYCKACIHFSSVHRCCMTRTDTDFIYLFVEETTQSCIDFQAVQLPYFLGKGGTL